MKPPGPPPMTVRSKDLFEKEQHNLLMNLFIIIEDIDINIMNIIFIAKNEILRIYDQKGFLKYTEK